MMHFSRTCANIGNLKIQLSHSLPEGLQFLLIYIREARTGNCQLLPSLASLLLRLLIDCRLLSLN